MDNSEDSNQHIQVMLNSYNYPKSVSYLKFLFHKTGNDESSNTSTFDNINCIQNADFNYKNSLYDTRGVSNGQVRLLCSSNEEDKCEKLRELFKENLQFTFQSYQIRKSSLILEQNFPNDIAKAENCCVLFILAEYKKDELVFKSDAKLQINKLIEYLDTDNLRGKPKLIFIQNSGNERLNADLQLPNDFLILISSGQQNLIDEFCQILSENYVEYDLWTILQKLKQSNQFYSIKSNLTKALFFKKRLTDDEWKIIKNDDLFYRKDQGRCHLMRYGNDCFKNESEGLEKKFIELNFETSTQVFDNDSLKRMLDNDMLHNHYAYDGFFVVMFLNDETNSEYIMNLIEHLTEVESLIGKPKVLLLFGPLNYTINDWEKSISNKVNDRVFTKKQYDDFVKNNIVILSKHADLMVYHSDRVSKTVASICEIFVNDNVNQYDLMSLLLMVSSEVDKPTKQEAALENKSSAHEIETNPISINSTLTRLVSLRTDELKAKFKLPSSIHKVLPPKKQGKCYIFNYQFYYNGRQTERTSAPNDQRLLESTFGNFQEFDVISFNDFTEEKTLNEVEKINCDGHHCLVVFILTHGNDNLISCFDKETDRNVIIEKIANNGDWKGKPKFIFFETCRGELEEKHTGSLQGDILPRSDSPLAKYPDMFIFLPTFEGHVSWSVYHSWSVMKLCNRLASDYTTYDIFTIVVRAAREICQECADYEIPNQPGQIKLYKLAKEAPTFYCTLKNTYSFS